MANTELVPSDGQPITTLAELNNVIEQADAAGTGAAGALPAGAYEIDLAGSIALTGALEALNLQSGVTLEINGAGFDINGESSQRGLFVYAGAVNIENLTIENAVAQGGVGGNGASAGGGGGAGLGGGLFVGSNVAGDAGNVTLNNVSFATDSAVGGAGGSPSSADTGGNGGGGGMGGAGGNGGQSSSSGGAGGGGGIGAAAAGGAGEDLSGPANPGGAGIVAGAAAGGAGGRYPSGTGGAGGLSGGGGGGGAGQAAVGGGGGGVNGKHGASYSIGGGGGYGGGGGGGGKSIGASSKAGGGGFGGGGGGSALPGSGGFGGGGGGDSSASHGSGGFGGFGGGKGASSSFNSQGQDIGGGGGGGLGAGGDIFVQQGASLSLAGGALSGGAVQGGASGSAGPSYQKGSAFGAGIFLQGTETIALGAGRAAGQTTTISDVIADQSGSGGTGANAGEGGLLIQGAGTVQLEALNTFKGVVTIDSGTLEIGANGSSGSGAITFAGSSATLQIDATPANNSTFANALDNVATGDQIDLRGLAFASGATAVTTAASGGGYTLTVVSGGTTEKFKLNADVNFAAPISDGAGGAPGVLLHAGPYVPSITGINSSPAYVDLNSTNYKPFANVAIADANPDATDTLTIQLSSASASLVESANYSGPLSLVSNGGGSYTLGGTAPNDTAANITAALNALQLNAGPGTANQIEDAQHFADGREQRRNQRQRADDDGRCRADDFHRRLQRRDAEHRHPGHRPRLQRDRRRRDRLCDHAFRGDARRERSRRRHQSQGDG